MLSSLLASTPGVLTAVEPVSGTEPAAAAERTKWFKDARFGMFIHWGVFSLYPGEWHMYYQTVPVADYKASAKDFTASNYDPAAWAALAKRAGMKYVVITAKHHDGFALYDSTASDWNAVKSSAAGRDLLAPLAEAVRAEGLKFGTYYSQTQDWVNPGGGFSDVKHSGPWDPEQEGDFDNYLKTVALPQVEELFAAYKPDIIWWDTPGKIMTGERIRPFVEVLERHPAVISNNRLGGDFQGDTKTPEQHIPPGGYPGEMFEVCMTMNEGYSWGYNKNEQEWRTLRQLLRNLSDIASKGGNLLLNVGPTPEGEIPKGCVERLEEIGRWMDVNGEAIYATEAGPFPRRLPWGRVTQKHTGGGAATLYLHVWEWPADGRLLLPTVAQVPTAGLVIANNEEVHFESTPEGLVVQLPGTAPDPDVSIVRLDFPAGVDVTQEPLNTLGPDGSVSFGALDADPHGGYGNIELRNPGPEAYLGGWLDPGWYLEYKLKTPAAGKWIVTAEVAASEETPLLLVSGKNETPVQIEATGPDLTWKTLTLGTIDLPAGETRFELRGPREQDGWKGPGIRRVWLTPEPTPGPTKKSTSPPEPWEPIELPNAGFEKRKSGWDFSAAARTARVVNEAALTGKFGLRIESDKDDTGAFVVGPRLPVERGKAYRLSWMGRVVRGGGTSIYLRFLDARGDEIQREEGRVSNESGGSWVRAEVKGVPPESSAFLDVCIQRPGFRPFPYTVDIDDFVLESMPLSSKAPWPGTYKLRPEETDRLTAADVIGPDGLVYPDFTFAGVPGGIPDLPVALRLEDFGAKPGEDISGLLEQASADLGSKGGGVIELGEGTFFLDQPAFIYSNNSVIRGAGRDKTRLVFRYHVPPGEIRFFRLRAGQEIGPGDSIEIHANPQNLVALEIKCGGESLTRRTRQDHWGNTFSLGASAGTVMQRLGEGEHTFTGIAEYADGSRVEGQISLRLGQGQTPFSPRVTQMAAISFAGLGHVSGEILLRADARRGTRTLVLAPEHDLAAGDHITLVAPASERWKNLVGHNSPWPTQAQTIGEVAAVAGDTITLRQPVRYDFLVEDGSYVRKQQLISGSGVESLSLEQQAFPGKGDLWISGITFNKSWGCWVRDVSVTNAGRNAVYFPGSAHIEVRDCAFNNSLYKGDGGTGYIGFDTTYESLMDNIVVRAMRHAPNVQWNASGNVIRNSRFLNSDGQWHAGFTMENLYENNFIDARRGHGSYGHGLYASGPSSGIHGPQGPRNVVYNNDIVSPLDSVFMRGGNEGWMILHNRFVCDKGRAIFAMEKSFDHIIKGNVFVLLEAVLPPVFLGADSTGVELVDNAFYGVTPPLVGFAGELTGLLVEKDNTFRRKVPEKLPERPNPQVASIYQWQIDNLAAIRSAAESRDSVP